VALFNEKVDGPRTEGGWELFAGEVDEVEIKGGKEQGRGWEGQKQCKSGACNLPQGEHATDKGGEDAQKAGDPGCKIAKFESEKGSPE